MLEATKPYFNYEIDRNSVVIVRNGDLWLFRKMGFLKLT